MTTNAILGVAGLTPQGVGIWGIFGLLLAWYVRGMADRKRADNEGTTAESKASEALFRQLQQEIDRLTKRVEHLELVVRECEHARALVEAENMQLRAAAMLEGRVREESAKVVAADRVNGRGSA